MQSLRKRTHGKRVITLKVRRNVLHVTHPQRVYMVVRLVVIAFSKDIFISSGKVHHYEHDCSDVRLLSSVNPRPSEVG